MKSFLLITFTLLASVHAAVELYVAPKGAKAGDGSKQAPYATLQEAVLAARNHPQEPVEIRLLPGRHEVVRTIQLGKTDQRTAEARLTIKAHGDGPVMLTGGGVISQKPQRVTDPAILSRLPSWRPKLHQSRTLPPAIAKKRAEDLSAHEEALLFSLNLREVRELGIVKDTGIKDTGAFGPRGFERPFIPVPVEVFMDGIPLVPAQWPNSDAPPIPLRKVSDPGSIPRQNELPPRGAVLDYESPRVDRWTKAEDFYIKGIFAEGHAHDCLSIASIDTTTRTMTTKIPHLYGFRTGRQKTICHWTAVNLLEEIDLPGESFTDRQTGMIYFLPPTGISANPEITVSILGGDFIKLDQMHHLTFESIIFENSRLNGIFAEKCKHIQIKGCTFRRLGGFGVRLIADESLIESCDFHTLGNGGIVMSGGDLKTLTLGHNRITNCHIHHFDRWKPAFSHAISISGFSHQILHNHIHDGGSQGVLYGGNDHLIALNRFSHLLKNMTDQGAIYTGRDLTCSGNIIRHNSFQDLEEKGAIGYGNAGIFLDDGCSHQRMEGNVFYNTGSNGAMKIHGGQANIFKNNLIIDCEMATQVQYWRQGYWPEFIEAQKPKLDQYRVTESPWKDKYPELSKIYETPYSYDSQIIERNYETTASDPVFADGKNLDFRVSDWKSIQSKVPGFEEIPIDKIGLYVDGYRKSLDKPIAR
jgi:Right handed beta helix region